MVPCIADGSNWLVLQAVNAAKPAAATVSSSGEEESSEEESDEEEDEQVQDIWQNFALNKSVLHLSGPLSSLFSHAVSVLYMLIFLRCLSTSDWQHQAVRTK